MDTFMILRLLLTKGSKELKGWGKTVWEKAKTQHLLPKVLLGVVSVALFALGLLIEIPTVLMGTKKS